MYNTEHKDNPSLGKNVGISIIIPCWGLYRKYLDECLASVYAQTYKDYEVILVTGCTDLPTARNRGIESATGEYILILDVDNKLTPDYLEKTVGKGDIVATYLQHFGTDEDIFYTISPTLEDLIGGNKVDANALYKRTVWEDVGGYDESMKDGWEDYEFWVHCLKKGYSITVVPEPILLYRKTPESMSVTAGRKGIELRNYILNKHGF